MQGYDQHMQDPEKNKMMTYSKGKKNGKRILKIKGVHLPNVARKLECAANHGRSRDFCNNTLQVCVWDSTFGANLSYQRVANTPHAMAEDNNGCDVVKGEDQNQSEDNSKCFPLKNVTPGNTMILAAILSLALIFGTRHQIIKIVKSKGLDTHRSIILLSSCLCMVKSVYGALKEAKDAGELVMFYLDVAKKGDKPRHKCDK